MSMKSSILAVITAVTLGAMQAAFAIPTLQVGAPGGAGEGTYADYVTMGADEDTAFTSGGTLYVAGTYGNNDLLVGGQYVNSDPLGLDGLNWGDFDFDPSFNTAGAVLMATVFGSGSLTVDSASAFYSTNTYEDGFYMPNPPSNHYPVQVAGASYLFFDIGDFSKTSTMVDFADESTGNQLGEIKTLSIEASGFDSIHFDVLALVTDTTGNTSRLSNYTTNTQGNPGSHDVTWTPPTSVPEPGALALLGIGLVGFAAMRRQRH
jgi:hypothetical protein